MTDDSRFFFGFCHICQIKFDADELSSERKMDFYFFWSGFWVSFWVVWGKDGMDMKIHKNKTTAAVAAGAGFGSGGGRLGSKRHTEHSRRCVITSHHSKTSRINQTEFPHCHSAVLSWRFGLASSTSIGGWLERMRQPKKKGEKTKTPLKNNKISFAFLWARQNGLPFSSSRLGAIHNQSENLLLPLLYITQRPVLLDAYPGRNSICKWRSRNFHFGRQKKKRKKQNKTKTGKNSADYTNDAQWLMYVFTQGTEKRWKFLRVRISSPMNY